MALGFNENCLLRFILCSGMVVDSIDPALQPVIESFQEKYNATIENGWILVDYRVGR